MGWRLWDGFGGRGVSARSPLPICRWACMMKSALTTNEHPIRAVIIDNCAILAFFFFLANDLRQSHTAIMMSRFDNTARANWRIVFALLQNTRQDGDGQSSNGNRPRFLPVTTLEDVQAIRCAEFHPQGSLYAVGSNSKTLRICAYPKLHDLRWVHDGKLLATNRMRAAWK